MVSLNRIKVENLGIIDYSKAHDLQDEKFNSNIERKLAQKPVTNTLLLCEHPHVFTLGKSGDESNLLVNSEFLKDNNASFYKTNRGGDITYHGPGQIVGYLHFDIDSLSMGTREFVDRIEKLIIEVLTEYDIVCEQKNGASGIWLNVGSPTESKVCAIGLKISRGISMHGFALNVNTNMSFFNYMNPCGHIGAKATSIQVERGELIDIDAVKKIIVQKFNSF